MYIALQGTNKPNKNQESKMKIFDLIQPALDIGCEFKIYNEDGIFCINLNTHAKSSCILKQKSDGIYAYRRYDKVDKVNNFNHLIEIVLGCAHHRNFFNDDWLEVFEEYGYKNPCL